MLYCFSDCELDTVCRELRRGGAVVQIEPQVFELLCHLVERSDQFVSKDELFETVWQGKTVSDAALSSRIKAARQAIGDTGTDQRLIRTLHGRGFRFVATVEKVDSAVDSGESGSAVVDKDEPLTLPDKPSIAVLPFDNLSADPEQEYFADGLTEDIITSLSKLSDMFVISRHSTFVYKGMAKDIRKIAEDLGVGNVLEGSVRKSGDRVRITGQLVDAKTGKHLWAERYDRQLGDIFDLQDDITRDIVTALRVKLTEGDQIQLRRRGTDSVEAWESYCRGQFYLRRFNKSDNDQAKLALEKVVATDPKFVSAWSHLAWVHYIDARGGWAPSEEAFERASECAERSLAIDDHQPDAYAMLGVIALHHRNYQQAVALGRRAIEVGPSFADNIVRLAMMLNYCGGADEAIQLVEKAMRLSPHYPDWYLGIAGVAYCQLGRYEEAIAADEARLALNPENMYSDFRLAAIYQKLGRYEEARTHVAQALRNNPSTSLSQIEISEPYEDPEFLDNYLELLRIAGMPE